MISEELLQFIWQYSLYNPVNLQTVTGEKITVIHPGRLNKNAGPDFDEARIRIGNTTLVGNIELHLKSSDWEKHRHQLDKNYQNIILHVVYEDDKNDPSHHFAKLVLKSHIPHYVLAQYSGLLHTSNAIPCASQLRDVNELTKESQLNRMLAERWEEKLADWKELLQQSKGDWQKLFYWRLAANFGFKINASPFLLLAQSVPVNLFAKHKEKVLQIEAILFGQAGMLDGDFEDEYPRQLQYEYQHLKTKYQLQPIQKHQWKFLRLRPANFPTIRIAQFAALVHHSFHLFSQMMETKNVKEIRELLNVTASEYWDTHYRFDEPQNKSQKKKLGKTSVDNIIINTIAPIRFLFAHQQDNFSEQEKSLQLLTTVPAENNNIISLWNDNGWKADNAAESQSLLQLYNNYCRRKRCLECAIGLSIIKGKK